MWFGSQAVSTEEFLRSTAHFGLYLVLGFLVCLLFWIWKRDALVAFLLGLSLPAVIAILDEYNQAFHGRQSTILDAVIDIEGALVGASFALLLVFFGRLLNSAVSRKVEKESGTGNA